MLGPLQDNGGPTFTHELLTGSPAFNMGDPSFTPPPDYDQRGPGFNRVMHGRIDIGAFEVQAAPSPTPTPTPSPTPSHAFAYAISFTESHTNSDTFANSRGNKPRLDRSNWHLRRHGDPFSNSHFQLVPG